MDDQNNLNTNTDANAGVQNNDGAAQAAPVTEEIAAAPTLTNIAAPENLPELEANYPETAPPIEQMPVQNTPETQTEATTTAEPVMPAQPIPSAQPITPAQPAKQITAEPIAPVQAIKENVHVSTDVYDMTPLPAVQDKNFISRLLEKANAALHGKKNERLDKISEAIIISGKISNMQVSELLGVSSATATRYLNALEKAGKVKQTGKTGRSVVYEKI